MKAHKGQPRGQKRGTEFVLRPLEIHYSAWRDRLLESRTLAIAEAVGSWQVETDQWLLGLTDNQKRDLVSLAGAEAHMLWMDVDQYRTYHKTLDVDWLREDFRERWYVLLPLTVALERLGIGQVSVADVEAFAMEFGWLP